MKAYKTILKKFTKQKNSILNHCLVKDGNLHITDIDNYISFSNVNLRDGLHDTLKIDLVNTPSEELDCDKFPVAPIVRATGFFKTSIESLIKLSKFISNDSTRLNLNGISFKHDKLVATNGHILKAVRLESVFKHDSNGIIISKDTIKLIIDLSKKEKISSVEINYDDNFCFCRIGENITVFGRLIQREFPKFESIIPVKNKYKFIIKSLPKYLDLKNVLNKKTNTVKLVSNEGVLQLLIKDHNLSWVIGSSDHDFTIAFNFKYLETIFNQNKGDSIFKFNNELMPVIVESKNDLNVIMPCKL